MQRNNETGLNQTNEVFTINNLPQDVLTYIFQYFTPEFIIRHLSRVNQQFFLASMHNFLWHHKHLLHFAYTVSQEKKNKTLIDLSLFKQTYLIQYSLDKLNKEEEKYKSKLFEAKLFSLVKEDSIEELKQNFLVCLY